MAKRAAETEPSYPSFIPGGSADELVDLFQRRVNDTRAKYNSAVSGLDAVRQHLVPYLPRCGAEAVVIQAAIDAAVQQCDRYRVSLTTEYASLRGALSKGGYFQSIATLYQQAAADNIVLL